MKKRIFSFFLALVMLFSCMSLNIFATEAQAGAANQSENIDTFVAHTDAQMNAAVASLTTAKTSNGTSKYSWSDSSKYLQNNNSSRLYVENGRFVIGARKDSTKTSNESYMQAASHTDWAGRDLLSGYANHYAKGKSVVASLDLELTEEFVKNTGTTTIPLIQFAVYQTTAGRDSTNLNQLGTYMPNLLFISVTGDTVTLWANPNNSNNLANLTKVTTLSIGKNYTIAIHLDPRDVDTEKGIYGSFDVYVDGECLTKRVSFMNRTTNGKMVFSTENPVAYFLDTSYDGYDTFKGGQAYFFLPTGTVLDDKTDSDGDSIPDLYEGVRGITADNASKITGYTCIGTSNGVKDMCLGFVRFVQVAGASKVAYTADAMYVDNLIVYYADEYVDVTEHRYTETHDHANNGTSVIKTECEFCYGVRTKGVITDANNDGVCDICVGELPTGALMTPAELRESGLSYVVSTEFNGTDTVATQTKGPDQNSNGILQLGNDNGDWYVKYGPITKPSVNGAYMQTNTAAAGRGELLKNFNLLGKSYAITFDFMHYGKYDYRFLLDLYSYTAVAGTKDENGIYTKVDKTNAINWHPIKMNADGSLYYFDGARNGFFDTGVDFTKGKFYNIVFYHNPSENSFSVYVDGRCVVANSQALDADRINQGTWTATKDAMISKYPTEAANVTYTDDNLLVMDGSTNFTLGFARFPQMASHTTKDIDGNTVKLSEDKSTVTINGKQYAIDGVKYALTADGKQVYVPTGQFFDCDTLAYDNLKVYYSDVNVECNHNYKLSHTHDIENNVNDVTYVCAYCNLTINAKSIMHKSADTSFNTLPAGSAVVNSDLSEFGSLIVGGNDKSTGIKISNVQGGVSFITHNGKKYVKVGTRTVDTTADTDYIQITYKNKWDTMQKLINEDNPIVGAPYVVSLDFIHYGVTEVAVLNQISSYINKSSSSKTVSFYPLYVKATGELMYRDAGVSKSTGYTLVPGKSYNVSFAHTPATNSYKVYVNGVLVVKNAIALYGNDVTNCSWTNANGKEIGPWSFTPGFFRSSTVSKNTKGDLFAYANVKFYHSDRCAECTHNYVGGTCEWCGIKDANYAHCDICDGKAVSANSAVVGKSTSLGEAIDMNVYMTIADELAKKAGAKVTLNCGARSAEFALADAKADANGLYKFSIELTSAQMAEAVEVAVEGESSVAYTTSVKAYAEELIATSENEAAVALAKAMLNYGAASQNYFAGKNGNADTLNDVLANAGLEEADKQIPDATNSRLFNNVNLRIESTGSGIQFTAATIMFSSKTHVKVYFTAPENATVTMNGKTVTPTKDGDEYYVTFSAQNPAEVIDYIMTGVQIVVTDGTNTASGIFNTASVVKVGAVANLNEEFTTLLNAYAAYCMCASEYLMSL